MASQRILITTFGSLGDLHPYLAIGQELRRRGHTVTVGTQALFRERVLAAGLGFRHLRATTAEEPSEELIRRVFAGASGPRYLLRELLLPALETAWTDTLAAGRDADLLVSHPLTMAAPLVAEKLGLPWISTLLAPSGLLSTADPPLLPGLAPLFHARAPRWLFAALFRLAGFQLRRWLRPVRQLARREGVSFRGHPFAAEAQSPFATLALFAPALAPGRADWPPHTTVTGFPFYDQGAGATDPALESWLRAGEPPLLFTLGSSAVMAPGDFFEESAAAARRLGRRALLVGYTPGGVLPAMRQGAAPPAGGLWKDDPRIFAAPYARYAGVFPRGAAVVHQGGIGTTAEAMRAGRPMLVVPFGVDQPDNARRVVRLGIARTLSKRRYRAARVARELEALLDDPAYARRAAEQGAVLRAANGAAVAAEAIEAVLRRSGSAPR